VDLDIDNWLKPTLDGLQRARLFPDDKQVRDLRVLKVDTAQPFSLPFTPSGFAALVSSGDDCVLIRVEI
jgi:hypothetical protein